jgi:hypothetical protein
MKAWFHGVIERFLALTPAAASAPYIATGQTQLVPSPLDSSPEDQNDDPALGDWFWEGGSLGSDG